MELKKFFRETEEEMKKALLAVEREFSELRTGRANPKIVEGLRINYYGTPTLLKEIASISVPEARLIVIHPWDPNVIKDIEKAIFESNLGITPSNDGKVVRLVVPPLSAERREELIKLARKIAEEGRVSVRTIRKEVNQKLKDLEKEKKISEDERFKAQEEVQKLTDKYIEEINKVLETKEKELQQF
ncbi:MAG TPA: ribosome recycling factor [Candidatus Omnitrophica bacterium]|nr:MAG: ribosome recycling factor [Candidatus Omnitrophota bacterium]RKY45069.1 MAG: ribosome recycling factor [Candidatus Omnitrophota bacterium]HEC69032.1 ribosome recycling factor [Candidatus Omnitrophota bacterium]